MKYFLVPVIIVTAGLITCCQREIAPEWKPVENPIFTTWGEKLDPAAAWPEYPRPALVRDEWMNLNGHAYCWYNNDPGENKNTYGALYNWYAIYTDKLCPSGWHIPELADWNTLIDNLGGASSAGGKLKESGTTHWKTTNTEVTNQSGFTALPAGYRSSWTGEFGGIGRDTYWWTNSGSLVYLPEAVYINDNEIKVHTGTEWRETGFSVRCIKD